MKNQPKSCTERSKKSKIYSDVSAQNTKRAPNNMEKLKKIKKAKKPGQREMFSVGV